MKEDGTIVGASISIDLSRIGYHGKVFLLITNAPNYDKSKTIAALEEMPNVFLVSEMMGDFEIIGIAPVKDLNSLRTLVAKIKKLPSVSRVDFTLINDTSFPVNAQFGKLFLK